MCFLSFFQIIFEKAQESMSILCMCFLSFSQTLYRRAYAGVRAIVRGSLYKNCMLQICKTPFRKQSPSLVSLTPQMRYNILVCAHLLIAYLNSRCNLTLRNSAALLQSCCAKGFVKLFFFFLQHDAE